MGRRTRYLGLREGEKEQEESFEFPVERKPVGFIA
jgi:hypothetical protein